MSSFANTALAAIVAALQVLGPAHPTATCCWCAKSLHPVCPYQDAQGRTKWKFYRCPKTACFRRQLRYFIHNDTDILFVPLPNQTEVFEAIVPIDASGVIQPRRVHNVLLLGSRGSSKSHLLRWLGHWLAMKLKDFRVLMLRRTLTELEQSQLVEVEYEAPLLGARYTSKYELQYPNGSLMYFGHCAEEGDEARYLSAAYDLILIDEEVTFTAKQIVDISTSARPGPRTPANWSPLVVGGTNTVGVSAAFLRAVYDTKVVSKDVMEEYDPDDFQMFVSFLKDNPFLPPDYVQNLKKLNPRKFQAWLNCDWDAGVDHFFSEWDKDKHTITTPTVIAPTIDRVCSLKWGYGSVLSRGGGCLQWWACLLDGKFILEDEFVFSETLVKDVAAEFHRRNERRRIKVRWVIANRLIFKPGGENIAETFLNEGVFLQRDTSDRINGWMRIRALLADDVDGIPFVRVVAVNCPEFCRTLPALVKHPDKPDDLLPYQDENCAEAFRQFAMSRPFPTPGAVTIDKRFPNSPQSYQHVSVEIPREALIGKAGGLRYAPDVPRSTRR